ncbi:MAG: hypothetical protein KGJ60_10040 [Verrucomicrobiota bacterium]|nr:hypothetical protein [Verrucomicrobiota bacterium]
MVRGIAAVKLTVQPIFCRAKVPVFFQSEMGGRHPPIHWRARCWKEVDADETTAHFWQELYGDTGKRIEMHEKFPVDKGHQNDLECVTRRRFESSDTSPQSRET